MPQSLTDQFESLANDPDGPVALHLQQDLVPVEGRGTPFFPPTFAHDEKYNIDVLADGTRVALVDSVGSQANRMEPLFGESPYDQLVPQVTISYGKAKDDTNGAINLLEAGHRLGDAVVRCTELKDEAHKAFAALKKHDATRIAKLAPTTLVFGAWDSRDTGVKVPRIVQGVIRAWDVTKLRRASQYVPALDYAALGSMQSEDELKKAEKDGYAERGFIHVPSTGDPGGVVARGPVRRDVTVNLVALRRLDGEKGPELRRYILGLSLIAATSPMDPFLRQGCLLVPDIDGEAVTQIVARSGERSDVSVDPASLLAAAEAAAKKFVVGAAHDLRFDAKLAKEDMKLAKKKK